MKPIQPHFNERDGRTQYLFWGKKLQGIIGRKRAANGNWHVAIANLGLHNDCAGPSSQSEGPAMLRQLPVPSDIPLHHSHSALQNLIGGLLLFIAQNGVKRLHSRLYSAQRIQVHRHVLFHHIKPLR